MFAEISVPTSTSEMIGTARDVANLSTGALAVISQAMLLAGGLWLIKKQNARLEEKEKRVEDMASAMIRVVENNNVVMEDIKELMEKIKSKSAALVLVVASLAMTMTGCSTSNITGAKHWEWQPPVSVVQAEKQYAVGTNGQPVLIKEINYFVQPGTNAPVQFAVKNRARTLADAKNNLTKAKSLLSDKTISAGVDALEQESKGDVVPNSIEKLGAAVPAGIKATSGIP